VGKKSKGRHAVIHPGTATGVINNAHPVTQAEYSSGPASAPGNKDKPAMTTIGIATLLIAFAIEGAQLEYLWLFSGYCN